MTWFPAAGPVKNGRHDSHLSVLYTDPAMKWQNAALFKGFHIRWKHVMTDDAMEEVDEKSKATDVGVTCSFSTLD